MEKDKFYFGSDLDYRIFPKYGPGVYYFQMASDQVLN